MSTPRILWFRQSHTALQVAGSFRDWYFRECLCEKITDQGGSCLTNSFSPPRQSFILFPI